MFSDNFQKTMKGLKRHTQMFVAEAEAAQMWVDHESHKLLTLMKAFKEYKRINEDILPCYFIPLGGWASTNALSDEKMNRQSLEKLLIPKETIPKAGPLHYTVWVELANPQSHLNTQNNARNLYGAIFWISAYSMIKMTQDFLDIARKLELVPKDRKSEDVNAAMAKVNC